MGFDSQFNYEYFITAEAGTVGAREPDFSKRNIIDMRTLRRESSYYSCGTYNYALGLYSGTFSWARDCPGWLSRGEEIYTLSFWGNRQKHIVIKERWHKYCWEELRDGITKLGEQVKKEMQEKKDKQDFEIAKWRELNPIRRGGKTAQELYNLTDEQAVERKKTIAYYNTYKSRLTGNIVILSALEENDPKRLKVIKSIQNINERLQYARTKLARLGGLPGTPQTRGRDYDAPTEYELHRPNDYDAMNKQYSSEGGDLNIEDEYNEE